MARMHPDSLDGATPTTGEAQVFALLQRALLPDDEHWVWYEPVVRDAKGARKPDFVVLGPEYGLVVLEVKDWSASSLGKITREWVAVKGAGGVEEKHTHPEKQAAEASYRVRACCRKVAGLTHEKGKYAGHLVVPVNFGVAYPHLSRGELQQYADRGAPIRPEKSLAREDLERDDEEGTRRLRAGLRRLCDVCFPFELTDGLRARVRAAVEPQLHFFDMRATAEPSKVEHSPLPKPWGYFLDRKQTRIARQLASPRTLVYGPAGSGKTVFLVARAQYWLDHAPEARVLYTCYNSSLASHRRYLFALKGLPPDNRQLTVRHYHDLCAFVLGRDDIHERDADFYRTLEPRLLQEMSRRDDLPRYDCILVDEGQDFTRRMLDVLVRLCADGGEITLVCDPAQDIYGRWSVDNLAPLRGHETERLVDCYRNTAPIFALALAVLADETRDAMGLNRLELTRPEDLGRRGPPPELTPLPGLDDLVTLIRETAEAFDRDGRSLSELAVLYPDRNSIPNFSGRLRHATWEAARDPRYRALPAEEDVADASEGSLSPGDRGDEAAEPDHPHFAEALERELKRHGLPAEWVARDFTSKASYDISRSRLTLSTIHSAKGMDFHTVILLGADTLPTREGADRDRAAALLFTGITRARERLVLPYFLDRGWVPELRERLAEIPEFPEEPEP
jgi:hypothetical protein